MKILRTRFTLALWLITSFFYFSLTGQWIRFSMNDKAFGEYMGHVLKVAAIDQRPATEVRDLLLIRAQGLSLPLHPDQIHVIGRGRAIRATVDYEAELSAPIFKASIYQLKFNHDISFDER